MEASLAILALVLLPGVQSPTNFETQGEAVYRLRIEADTPRILHFDAELPRADGRLTLGVYRPQPEDEPMPFTRSGLRSVI